MTSMKRNVFFVRSSKNEDGKYDYAASESKQRRLDHAMYLVDSLLVFKNKSMRENTVTNLALFCDLPEVRSRLCELYKTVEDLELKKYIKKLYDGKVDTSQLENLKRELLEEESFVKELLGADTSSEDLS